MSRPWMPWYIGDYLRDTAHLTTEQHGAYLLLLAHCWQHGRIPISQSERAAVTKTPLRRWRLMSEPINKFFEADGTQKRVTQELEKAETVTIQRRMAGTRGGISSAIAKAAAKQIVSKRQAIASVDFKQTSSGDSSKGVDSHKVSKKEEENQTAGLLATAHPTGALARPPCAELGAKRPSEVSRSELEAAFAVRHQASSREN